jgi:hypothetical protein
MDNINAVSAELKSDISAGNSELKAVSIELKMT